MVKRKRKRKSKSPAKEIAGNIAADMTQGIGLIAVGSLQSKIPAAGQAAFGNVYGGMEIQSLSSLARGAKTTISALKKIKT